MLLLLLGRISSASVDPDTAYRWVKQSEYKKFRYLAHSGGFRTLDRKVWDELYRVVPRTIRRKLAHIKRKYARKSNPRIPKGRQALWVIRKHLCFHGEDAELDDYEDFVS